MWHWVRALSCSWHIDECRLWCLQMQVLYSMQLRNYQQSEMGTWVAISGLATCLHWLDLKDLQLDLTLGNFRLAQVLTEFTNRRHQYVEHLLLSCTVLNQMNFVRASSTAAAKCLYSPDHTVHGWTTEHWAMWCAKNECTLALIQLAICFQYLVSWEFFALWCFFAHCAFH